MADVISTVERDGFEGKVYAGKKGNFVAWKLAELTSRRGNPVAVTAITGENGVPKAAAWNLTHAYNPATGESEERAAYPFLQRVLKSRVQLSRGQGGSVDVTVPGAQIQGVGYDEPLALTLKANVASARDLPVALSLFAGTIASVTARGVYATLTSQESEEPENEPEDDGVEELQF
jgi:hypothetical protein